MATPPAEAPSIQKEEKPQLPPSPNGISSPDVVTGYVFTFASPCCQSAGIIH